MICRSPISMLGLTVSAMTIGLLAPTAAQTLQGQVETQTPGDVFSHNTGLDPLAGKPEITPTAVGPGGSRCIPLNASWRLMQQSGDTCYWYAPLPQRLEGYVVVPMSQVAGIERQGRRCGVNPFDVNVTAVCQQPLTPEKPPVLTGRIENTATGLDNIATVRDVKPAKAVRLKSSASKIVDFTPLFDAIRLQELNSFGSASSRGRQSYDVDLTINRNGPTPLPVKATAKWKGEGDYSAEVEKTISQMRVPTWPKGSKLDHVALNQNGLVVGVPDLRLKQKMIVLEIQTSDGSSQVIQYPDKP
jgi:hypothetical protein